jgi:Putative zinc-finger
MTCLETELMDHSEAIKQMAAERYLLDELPPEARDDFEEHAFDCPECSVDLRAGAAFISEAKIQLPTLSSPVSEPTPPRQLRPTPKKRNWSFWWQPSFALPVFAVLLGVIAYQNLTLRRTAEEPRVLRTTSIHAGTRGSAHVPVPADRTQGLALSIELPQTSTYASYAFELYDPSGKKIWSKTMTSSNQGSGDESTVSLIIPGQGLRAGSYSLNTFGLTANGDRTEIDRHALDVQFGN